MIAPRAGHLATLTAILLFLALGLGNGPLLVFALTTGGLLAALLTDERPRGVSGAIGLDRRHPRVGDILTVRMRATVRGGRGALMVHMPLPDGFQLVEGRNLASAWKGRQTLRIDHTFRVRCGARGNYTLGPLETVAHGSLRAHTPAAWPITEPLDLVVAPRVRAVRRIQHVRGKARTPLAAGDAARTGEQGRAFRELRDYVAGDPLHRVNWKATARRSTGDLVLTVNEYEPEGRKAVWVFIDAAAYMEVGRTDENSFDRALEGALAILEHFGRRGHRLGATVYHHAETRVFYPDTGGRQLQRLVRAFSTLDAAVGGDDLPTAVARSRGFLLRERPLVLLVTRPEADPEATQAGIRAIRTILGTGPRAPPVMLLAPTPLSHSLKGGHGPLAVQALRLATDATYHGLRRQGVRVLDWDPGHTPLEGLLLREVAHR